VVERITVFLSIDFFYWLYICVNYISDNYRCLLDRDFWSVSYRLRNLRWFVERRRLVTFALMVIVRHPQRPDYFDGLATRTAFGLALADGVSVSDHRMLCPGVRGRVVGVVGRMVVLVLGGCAGMALGVVWVALVIRTGENLRGSLLGNRSSIAMSFHRGGVRVVVASCGGDWIRFGDGYREVPFVGRLGDGHGLVGRPRWLRGFRGNASDGAYVNRALNESG